jgi:hypothetical protein
VPIYESPDHGETIYAREPGSTDRVLVSMSAKAWALINEREQAELWADIRKVAEHNTALQEALERVKVLYYLSKDNGNT